MSREELLQRIHAHRGWERSITMPSLLPLMVIWLGGSWLIMDGVILADQSYDIKDRVLLALLFSMLLAELVIIPITLRKSAFRSHGLLCPQCDARILNIWNPQKVLETGRCHHCGHALVDANGW